MGAEEALEFTTYLMSKSKPTNLMHTDLDKPNKIQRKKMYYTVGVEEDETQLKRSQLCGSFIISRSLK